MVCRICSQKTCVKHQSLVEKGYCCKIGKQEKENAASIQLIEKITKQCPNCKIKIERNGGCLHMTCIACGHEWFWCCLRPYRNVEEAQAHFKECLNMGVQVYL